jgi:CRP-like cAMP-binding protein
MRVHPDEYLFRKMDTSDKVYFLLSGQVKVLSEKDMKNESLFEEKE